MPQSQKRRLDGGRNKIFMLGGHSMCFNKMLSTGEERWFCSRRTLGEDAAGEVRHCQGSARKFPWEDALRLHTVHSPWCLPKQGDEEIRAFNDELHQLAAADETLPASTAVDMAKHGKSPALLKRLPKDDSLEEKVNRRRNDGSLHLLNDVDFDECVVPLSFQQTLGGHPYLILDYRGDGRLLVFSSPAQIKMRLDRKEEWKTSARYTMARDNPRFDGSPRPITTRSGRQRARKISSLLRAECRLYKRDPERGGAERRQQHVEAIGIILSRYQHRKNYRPLRKDRRALTAEEIEEMQLPPPGATEEGDDDGA